MEEQNSAQPILMITNRVTPKAYEKFFMHWMRRRRKGYFIYWGIVLLLIAAGVFLGLVNEHYGALSILSSFLVLCFTLYLPKRYYDNHREMYRSQTTYAFYEAHFYSSCDAMGTRHYKATPYVNCKAAETKSAFYLSLPARPFEAFYWGDYFDPDPYGASAILDKRCLTEDQQQVLRELFARKFGEKFKAL